MKPKSKRSTLEVHVPQDVMFDHILPRIPAKSGYRFRCVSKEWHSFLKSDTFKNKYNGHHIDDLKFLVLSKTETSFEFTTIDGEAPPTDRQGLTTTRRPVPPFEDTTPYDIRILTSFHGLVCLGIIKDKGDVQYSDLILWNPLTSEYKRLSKSTHLMNRYIWYSSSVFGLYYSRCEDDYKLLCLNQYNHYVYMYSWRKADVFQLTSRLYPGSPSPGITYLHENLYFLQHNSNEQLSSIIRFDTKTERFSKIETPNVDDIPNEYSTNYYDTIMVKSNCIHVCVKYDCDSGFGRTTCIKLWKLDEYENMKEVLTCQLKPHGYAPTTSSLRPLHLMNNGNYWLMMLKHCWPSCNDGIYKVDLRKRMHITNKGKEKGNIYDAFVYMKVRMDEYTNMIHLVDEGVIRYIETFVSPNR